MRRFAIGDIHGCAKALRTVIEEINPSSQDTLVFLGDYIDRGPDSRDVVQQIIDLKSRCRVFPLLGNHELMLSAILERGLDDAVWLASGGRATVASYGGKLSKIPDRHLEFFRALIPYYDSDDTICVHAGYDPMMPMDQQRGNVMHWNHLPATLPLPHVSGKRVFIGHTPQPTGNILDVGHLVCIDTYCFGGGFLTAFDLDSNRLIQVDHHGHLRRERGAAVMKGVRRLQTRIADYVQLKWPKVSDVTGEAAEKPNVSEPEST